MQKMVETEIAESVGRKLRSFFLSPFQLFSLTKCSISFPPVCFTPVWVLQSLASPYYSYNLLLPDLRNEDSSGVRQRWCILNLNVSRLLWVGSCVESCPPIVPAALLVS